MGDEPTEVSAGTRPGEWVIGRADASTASGDEWVAPPSTGVAFWPEWGRSTPLWGGEAVERLDLAPEIVERMREWMRVWNVVLNPETPEARWSDDAVGWEWIAEGHRLVAEVERAASALGLTVEADFDEYSPEALRADATH
jgi:hypothetical protein